MQRKKTRELELVSRAAEVTAETLLAFKKSLDNLSDDADMDIIQQEESITPKQKEFLERLIRFNTLDGGEREVKVSQIDSYSRADADLAIKQYLGR